MSVNPSKNIRLRRGLLPAVLRQGVVGIATAGFVHAAVINWQTPVNVTGDSDVSTAGTLVGAVNLGTPNGPSATTTVNGVTFAALNGSGTSVSAGTPEPNV